MKPEKYSWKVFLLSPVWRVGKWMLKKVGWWYCYHCKELHSPRTIKKKTYTSQTMGLPMCSLAEENLMDQFHNQIKRAWDQIKQGLMAQGKAERESKNEEEE